ncbi:MAG: tetratricopeptide repeat protein [Bacteroidia bacterium]
MKKKYFVLIAIAALFISAIFMTRTKEPADLKLKDRTGKISASAEWLNTKKAIEGLEDQLRRNPGKTEIKLKLSQAYMQEGRVTGDHDYYDALAFKLTNEVLKSDPENFEALCCKATLQASAHQFAEALITTRDAIKINPYNSYIYGVECDAMVELGKYDEAIKTGDKMVSIRPDIRSYSRISYLREILGDYPGAIDAMKLALEAGYPGLEQTEWVRSYLGRLYEITGNQQTAEAYYQQALTNRQNFAPALAGMGRIEKARKNYAEAIQYYTNASSAMQDYSFHHELALLYRKTNEKEKSDKEFQTALDLLMKHKHPTSEENGIGHNIDRELAMVYTSMHENDKALNNAIAEYERRPDNIDVNEVLGWAYYNSSDYNNARIHILKALSTKSKNAELWYKAGLIFKANNYEDIGNKYLAVALKTNPTLDTVAYTLDSNKNNLASR